jgi:hypothetical protein
VSELKKLYAIIKGTFLFTLVPFGGGFFAFSQTVKFSNSISILNISLFGPRSCGADASGVGGTHA